MVVAKYYWGVVITKAEALDIMGVSEDEEEFEFWESDSRVEIIKTDFEFETEFDGLEENYSMPGTVFIVGIEIGETRIHYSGGAMMPSKSEIEQSVKNDLSKYLESHQYQKKPAICVFLDAEK
jgi:hypothetical protein